jgi:dolichyldiphosphatase
VATTSYLSIDHIHMDTDGVAFKSFSLTHVSYVEGDTIGKLLALVTLSPIFIIVMYSTILMTRRDIQTLFIVIGQLLNVFLNLTLKKLIKEPRPQERYLFKGYSDTFSDICRSGLDDEGMPSNHSQFIAFFCVVYSFQFLFRCKNLPRIFRWLYTVALLGLAVLVCYSRYTCGMLSCLV